MVRALFYLPVVTPWWFDNIVAPLIRTLSREAEVHVLAPAPWRNTGIGPEQIAACSDLADLRWHIVDGDGHHSLRTHPDDREGLIDFVRSIGPDYVFCRSADIATPAAFPGKVVHLLEAGAPPFATDPRWIILQRDFWHHGAIASLSKSDEREIENHFSEFCAEMRRRLESDGALRAPRADALASLGLPQDRKILALPLEYEHEEAFTAFHGRFQRNLDLVRHVANRLDERFLLAITDHPLNWRHVDNSHLHAAIEALGPSARLIPNPDCSYRPTDLLVRHCDGLIVQNTKAIYAGAELGKPVLRLSQRPTAEWIGAQTALGPFLDEVASGATGASEDSARLWFGYHLLHEVVDPASVSAAEILDRIDRPFCRRRLATGKARLEAHRPALDEAA